MIPVLLGRLDRPELLARPGRLDRPELPELPGRLDRLVIPDLPDRLGRPDRPEFKGLPEFIATSELGNSHTLTIDTPFGIDTKP